MDATHLNLEITKKCNQNCFYCFNNSSPVAKVGEISLDRWLQILSKMQRWGLQSIHVTGGEPMIWDDTIHLLDQAQGMGLNTSILSNGLRISALAQSHPEVLRKLQVAQISLDAMDPELHDRRRGLKGAWKQAMNAVSALRSLQVPVEISSVISDENISELNAIAQYTQTIGGQLIIRPLVPVGRGQAAQLAADFTHRLEEMIAGLQGVAIVHDRFQYVPVVTETDMTNAQQGILTVEADGQFRGAQQWRSAQGGLTNALELLNAA